MNEVDTNFVSVQVVIFLELVISTVGAVLFMFVNVLIIALLVLIRSAQKFYM